MHAMCQNSNATSSSVLSSGKWIKIAISQDGVYQIPYSKLRSMGFSNPENIRIFGNDAGMLPFYNNEDRIDDLSEKKVLHINNSVFFYAKGPDIWSYSSEYGMYLPLRHLYSRTAYCFVSDVDTQTDNLMPQYTASPRLPEIQHGTFCYHHEQDLVNLLMSGRRWLGENFFTTTSHTINFDCINIPTSGTVMATMVSRAPSSSGFTVSWNEESQSTSFTPVGNSGPYADSKSITLSSYSQQSNRQSITISYNKTAASSEGYIDYVCLNTTEPLIYHGQQFSFRTSPSSVGSTFSVVNNENISIMAIDVSNSTSPTLLPCSTSNGVSKFTTPSMSENIAIFAEKDAMQPEYISDMDVPNQNLHGISTPNLLIITPSNLMQYANRIKALHTDLTTQIVTASQIYNEFSSGMCDVSAIRDFIRHLYNKDNGHSLRYVLLLGDGSVDNITSSVNNPNILPTYQTENSFNENNVNSLTTDDFFVLLDTDEGECFGIPDVSIGRIPAKNADDAEAIVSKMEAYHRNRYSNGWQKNIVYIADDGNNNIHCEQADYIAEQAETNHPEFDNHKIYLDNYRQESSAAGNTYPDARRDILQWFSKGALIINYTGHGGMKYFSDERVFTITDINNLKNSPKLPIMITASCNIGHFDHYDNTTDRSTDSPAERLLLNPDGGTIAMLSTTREVLSLPNFTLCKNIYNHILDINNENTSSIRLGDIVRMAKSETNDYNMLCFTLFGDPALELPIPHTNITISKINGIDAKSFTDTLHATNTYNIECDIDGNPQGIGTAYINLYDKPTPLSTLNNSGDGTFYYTEYQTKIFSGRSSINNGHFSFNFTVPKDINYTVGHSKLSLYADGDNPAIAVSKSLLVGGSSNVSSNDITGPQISISVDGAPSNAIFESHISRPTITVSLYDESGINITGNGHDICIFIDSDITPLNLNDYYTPDKDCSTSGIIQYQLPTLSSGSHTIKIKCWDNLNNSSESQITVLISESDKLKISHLLNYPNPFTDHTQFMFEHNSPLSTIEYEITIFTMSGKVIKILQGTSIDAKPAPIYWDGRDTYGNPIARGVYFYKLKIKNSEGKKATAYEKLLILK